MRHRTHEVAETKVAQVMDFAHQHQQPLHHREVHRSGNEESWWWTTRIDPLAAARSLWLETRPLPREEASAVSSDVTE
jgi:hypothetical protein